MVLKLVMLLLLPQGYTLVPATTVSPGEPATFTCRFPPDKLNNNEVHWYKQSTGDTLTLIVRLRKHAEPAFGPEFLSSRMTATKNENVSKLTILRTVQQDEGMYHCAIIDWTENTWHGFYLLLKENTERTSGYTIYQQFMGPEPHLPEDSVTLQCSVLTDSDNQICPGDPRVFWFRARPDSSYPHIIYTGGNKHNDCKKKYDSQRRCVFSKNISSTDNDTYYCAVAICGEVFIGNGTKAVVQGFSLLFQDTRIVFLPLCGVLVFSFITIAVLVFSISTSNNMENKAGVDLDKYHGGEQRRQGDDSGQFYSVVVFSVIKPEYFTLKQQ